MSAAMPTRSGVGKSRKTTACAEYSFRQRFRVPAAWAFRWCIDYTPYRWGKSQLEGSRTIAWVGPRTVVLDDIVPAPRGRRARKVKMVQVYPETRSWVSTHVAGPRLNSQFRYRIEAEGRNASALVFDGRELRWDGPRLSAAANRRLAKELRADDADLWKRFAVEMEREYSGG